MRNEYKVHSLYLWEYSLVPPVPFLERANESIELDLLLLQ